ncbi:MAG: MBOAT family O-acyltransferase [Elusimicrobiota bacterium]
MPFGSPLFLVFFVAFFFLYYFAAARRNARLCLLIGGSAVFYGSWGWRFVPILGALGTVNFLMAPVIARASDPRGKRLLLAAVVALDAAPLLFFRSLPRLAAVPSLLVPVGISFYTLQCVAYVVDVYRGSLRPAESFAEFMAALVFFPRLAAGPLARWPAWLPQFARPGVLDRSMVERGFLLAALGLLKMTIGDLLAPVADGLFAAPAAYSTLGAWTGLLAFAGQMYGQFAGYSDVAIGLALLLGFALPPNFDLPYLSASPIEFWRRWHISLSSWLYEYLYLPLALTFRAHAAACVFATVLFAGLWHGIRPTLALYGVYHALLLIGAYWFFSLPAIRASGIGRSGPARAAATALNMYLMLIGFVLFRAGTAGRAWDVWVLLHGGGRFAGTPRELSTMAFAAAAVGVCHAIDWWARAGIPRSRWLLWPATALGFGVCFAFGARADFAYFH